MKHSFLLLLFYMGFSTSQAQDMDRVRQTIDTLCAPAMHGRGYLFGGDAKAARYLASRLEAAGTKAWDGGSYYQPFTLQVNRITETPELRAGKKKLLPGHDFIAQAASSPGKGKARPLLLDTLVFTDAAAAQQFFTKNFRKQALVYPARDRQQLARLPQPYRQQLAQAKLHVVLQPKELLGTVARQQSEVPALEVKASEWPVNVKRVKYKIKSELVPAYETQNVISFIEGSVKPDSFIVFTAHYDHLGGQGKDVYFPGANDNASGTAMLLELAAHYSLPQHRPSYSMAFIAFAAEEAGLVGSIHYVQHPLFPLSQIRFLVNLDLLGTGDEGMMVVNGSVHTREFNLLSDLNRQNGLLPQVRSRGKAANSDHYPFSEADVPAFFFYTLGGTTAYHNIHDRPEQLPLTRFPEVFKLITRFADALQK